MSAFESRVKDKNGHGFHSLTIRVEQGIAIISKDASRGVKICSLGLISFINIEGL